MATFWERAANSVYHMLSVFLLIVILVIFHSGFARGTLVLIASVPCHCLSFTFCQNVWDMTFPLSFANSFVS